MRDQWDRRVERILTDIRGRDALKRFGIHVEMAGKKNDKPIVAILCPAYRSPDPRMGAALRKAIDFCHENDIATIYEGAPVSGSIIHWVRNWLFVEQLKSGRPWSNALMIDDDIVVAEPDLAKLVSHKKDIVAGLCTRRNDPPIPNIRFYDIDGQTRQIWEWPENELIQVDAVGTGLMLVSKNAMEQVAQVYFDCLWEQDFYGLSGQALDSLKKNRLSKFDEDKTCYWFRTLPTPKGDIEMGEDVTFCYLAKKYCGLSVYVDTSVQPGHIGVYEYSVKDFLPYRDMCIERAKKEGNYKTQPKLEPELQVVG